MDLFEYQAKDLFAEYGVPVQPGKVASTAGEARDIAAEFAAQGHPLVVVKAQVKTGGRGKAGGVKLAERPGRGLREGQPDPRHGHQGPHRAHGADRPGRRHRGRVLPVVPARPGQPDVPGDLLGRRAAWRSRRSRTAAPRRVARIPVDAAERRRRRQGAEIVAAGRIPAEAARGRRPAGRTALGHVHRRGRHAGRGQPDGADRRRPGPRARRQGHAGRQRRLPPGARQVRRHRQRPTRWRPGPRRSTSTTSSSTARSASSATAPAWSCPPWTWWPTPGEAFGGIRPANFLDIGGGASAEVMANGLEIVLSDPSVRSVFVNVFGGITSCDAVANGIVSAHRHAGGARRARGPPDRGPAGRQQRRARAGASCRGARYPLVEQVDTMDGAARRAAELAAGSVRMAIFLTGDSRVMIQGITGSEGRKHGARMLAAGTNDRRRHQPAQGGPDRRPERHRRPGVRHGRRDHGRDRRGRVGGVRARRPAPRTR